jgi:hypothetical protein
VKTEKVAYRFLVIVVDDDDDHDDDDQLKHPATQYKICALYRGVVFETLPVVLC